MRATSVASVPPGAPSLTVAEWAVLDEDHVGEFVDGHLVEAEMPDAIHESVIVWLIVVLSDWGRPRGARVFGSGARLAIGPDRGRMPDASVFLAGRKPPARGAVTVPPDIVVEVVSTGLADQRRDRIEKVDDYARFGVRWYWIVDPQLRTFEVWELREGAYARVGAATRGPVGDIPGCEGLVLDLDALWSEIDGLA